MALINVDENKCKKDGMCAAVCPIGAIIEFDDKKQVPKLIEEFEYLCMNCGHCVSVCPQGALTHQNLSPEECQPVKKELALNPEQAEHFLMFA